MEFIFGSSSSCEVYRTLEMPIWWEVNGVIFVGDSLCKYLIYREVRNRENL